MAFCPEIIENEALAQNKTEEKNTILLKNYLPINFRGMRRVGKIISPEFLLLPSQKNRLIKLNLLRCESHKELLENVLSKILSK